MEDMDSDEPKLPEEALNEILPLLKPQRDCHGFEPPEEFKIDRRY